MPPAGSLYAPSPLKQHNSLPKLERLDDDKRSTLSRASGVPRAEHALDILQLVAGNRVRHASCAPEFLEEIASKGAQNSLKKSPHRTFKIIHGSEARSYFKEYVRGHPSHSDKSLRNDHDNFTKQTLPSPIVFAVTVWEGETKCVDYYMTWRGKKNESSSEEYQREVDYLDAQFRRLAKGLDKEYKSISALRTYSNLSKPRRKLDRKSQLLSQFPDSRTTRVPPGITISAAEEASPLPTQQSLPEPPVSASDSVMSLPLLNMIRGVPFSHRVPLRVTNPDRLSLISDITIAAEETTTVKPQPSLDTSNTLVVPTGDRSSKHGRTLEDTVNASSASIRSSDTRSSKSSRSSRSSTHYGSENSRNPSPDRESRSSQRDRKIPEYLIVLLGDKYDTDPTSWHG
ncbi:hypothetical protein CPC08DRAFT_63434 [Agrocybe pediades]|nr:hypothetical protein CPC08DRAFT_63434 [Agrocybe pediades]